MIRIVEGLPDKPGVEEGGAARAQIADVEVGRQKRLTGEATRDEA